MEMIQMLMGFTRGVSLVEPNKKAFFFFNHCCVWEQVVTYEMTHMTTKHDDINMIACRSLLSSIHH